MINRDESQKQKKAPGLFPRPLKLCNGITACYFENRILLLLHEFTKMTTTNYHNFIGRKEAYLHLKK